MYFFSKFTVMLILCIVPLKLFADHKSDVIDGVFLVCTNAEKLLPSQTFIEINKNRLLKHSDYVNHIYKYDLEISDEEVKWTHKIWSSQYSYRLNNTTLNRSTLKTKTNFTSFFNDRRQEVKKLCDVDVVNGDVIQRCEGTLHEECQLKNQKQFLLLLEETRRPYLEKEQKKKKKLNRKF